MQPRLIAFTALLLVLPGCLSAPAEEAVEPAAADDTAVEIDESRPDTQFTLVETGPGVGADEAATLDKPPVLVEGEWWRLRFDNIIDGEPIEVVRVVSAVEDDRYLIGMPHEGWFKEAIAYHSPAFGDVFLDLSYNTHNVVFQPLKFPLREGDTWETHFAASPLIAQVEKVEGTQATVVFYTPDPEAQATDAVFGPLGMVQPGGEAMRIIYDAAVHEVVYYESFVGTYEVVDHGYNYEGWTTIPRGHDTAIDYGQFLAATPGEPVVQRTIDIAGGFNRLTLMQAVFPLGPGAYRVRAVAPDQTEFMTESVGDAMTFQFHESRDPDGKWLTEDVVAGPGVTYSMGIAYHQYDIRLPDGARRSDHSHEVVR